MENLDFYKKVEKKLLKNKKCLAIVIDYNKKKEYNPNFLQKTQNLLTEQYKLKKEMIFMYDLNLLPPEILVQIKETPAYFYLTLDNNEEPNIEAVFTGYLLKKQ